MLRNLASIRRARRLTQADVARLVGISQQYYSALERGLGIPHPSYANLLAAALQVDPALLDAPAIAIDAATGAIAAVTVIGATTGAEVVVHA